MNRPSWPLLLALLMFPQVVETAYSPALPSIAAAFAVLPAVAGQTLSVYFAGFAAGVLVWGVACDRIGRRRALLAGLACYAAGVGLALLAGPFEVLLLARVLAAFGAAAGSIVGQTLLRDHYQGADLAMAFARAGVAIAISPALGLAAGVLLVAWAGHQGVFVALAATAVLLLAWAWHALPPRDVITPGGWAPRAVLRQMAADRPLQVAMCAIALWNLQVFGFHEVAPFALRAWGLPGATLGVMGVALAAGAVAGAMVNRRLAARQWPPARLLVAALVLDAAGVAMMLALRDSGWALLGMPVLSAAFALAIPQLLGTVLAAYSTHRGTAGALLGLGYYLLLAAGLAAFAWGHSLVLSLLVTVVATAVASACYARGLAGSSRS